MTTPNAVVDALRTQVDALAARLTRADQTIKNVTADRERFACAFIKADNKVADLQKRLASAEEAECERKVEAAADQQDIERLRLELGTTEQRLASAERALEARDAAMAAAQEERDWLRARIVDLLRCHYEEHRHIGSPTCFDVQAPSDEWENAALARPARFTAASDSTIEPAISANERRRRIREEMP